MAKQLVKLGATDRTEYLWIPDSSSTTGAGLTGLAYNAAGLKAYYIRPGGTATQISLATQTVNGAHSDGGFVEVSSSNMPGLYRFDPPDAVFASGVDKAAIVLSGATNMPPVPLEYQLVAFDPADATRLGLSSLPNAAAGANGGLPTVDGSNRVAGVSGNVAGSVGSVASGGITSASFGSGAIDATAIASDAITAAKIASDALTAAKFASGAFDAVWSVSSRTITGTVTLAAATHTGAVIPTVSTLTGHTPQTGDSYARIGANGAGLTALGDSRIANLDAAVSSRGSASTLASVASDLDALGTIITALVEDVDGLRFTAKALEEAPTGGSAPTAGEIADAVWDEAQSGHTSDGTFGKYLDSAVSGVSTGGVSAADIADAVWDEARSGHATSGTFGEYIDAAISSRSTYAGGAVASVTGNVGGNVVGSVGSVSSGVTVTTNNDKTGYALSSSGLDAITIETGVNARQSLSVIMASAAGVLTYSGNNATIKGGNVSTTRITAVTDGTNQRTSVTLNLPS